MKTDDGDPYGMSEIFTQFYGSTLPPVPKPKLKPKFPPVKLLGREFPVLPNGRIAIGEIRSRFQPVEFYAIAGGLAECGQPLSDYGINPSALAYACKKVGPLLGYPEEP